MSAPHRLRCLARPTAAISTPTSTSIPCAAAPRFAAVLARTAPFSTTSQRPAEGSPRINFRKGKSLQLGKFKKDKAEKGKSPLPGERKAYRKRITLSNDNAIAVPWLTELGPADLADAQNITKIMSLPEEVQDQLRASEAFKTTQCWGMFRKPSLLVRKETVELANKMQAAAEEKNTLRLVVTGEKVAGKSMMLLQAMTHAFLNNWIVIHFPEGASPAAL